MKKIYSYNEFKFKLIKEESEEDLFGENENENENEEESSSEEEFNFDESEEDNEENDEFSDENQNENEDEDEDEEPKEITYNEDPSHYISNSIDRIENIISDLFENPLENTKPGEEIEKDPSSYVEQGVELLSLKKTNMPMNKTLIAKYADNNFMYHLYFTINIEQGVAEEGEEMDSNNIEECGIKFKKYDLENNLIGELERKKVPISEINQDYIDSLNGELDNKYSVKDEFEIEYEEEDEN
jgi:thymidylate synthase